MQSKYVSVYFSLLSIAVSPVVLAQEGEQGFNFEIAEDSQPAPRRESPAAPIWGDLIIGIGGWKPSFENIVGYETLYEKTSVAPMIAIDQLFYQGLIGLGLRFHAALYSDDGFAAEQGGEDGTINRALSEPTRFIAVPLHFGVGTRIPVFFAKYANIGLGAGYERVFHQEVRGAPAEADPQTPAKPFVNRGWKNLLSVHAELGIRIGDLERKSGWTVDALGLRAFYLSFLGQLTRPIGAGGMDLSGINYAAMFSFELD
jgi:hypothetical protein